MSGAGMGAAPCVFGMGAPAGFWAQAGKPSEDVDRLIEADGNPPSVFVGGRPQKLFAPAVTAFLTKHDAAGQAGDSLAA